MGIPGVQGSEGEPGIYDPNLDEIRNGSEGPQGPIGKLYLLILNNYNKIVQYVNVQVALNLWKIICGLCTQI